MVINYKLKLFLDAATILCGDNVDTKTSNDLRRLLYTRLTRYYDVLDRERTVSERSNDEDLEILKLQTGVESLYVLEHIETLLAHKDGLFTAGIGENGSFDEQAALGVKDMAYLRRLTSIIFNWGTSALLSRLFPRVKPSKNGTAIIDLTDTSNDFSTLSSIIIRVFAILLPGGLEGSTSQSFIATNLLTRHLTDLLKPSIFTAWLPKPLHNELGVPPVELRKLVLRLLSLLSPSQTISSLGAVISSKPPVPVYVQKTCAGLLSRQLLRVNGVRGLFASMFGENEASEPESDAPIERLEQVAKVLRTVPAGLSPEAYYNIIVPQVLDVLSASSSNRTPPAHRWAAAFSLARMLSDDKMSPYDLNTTSSILLPVLHDPFRFIAAQSAEDSEAHSTAKPASLEPQDAIMTLTTIFTNTDPSPKLINTLLTPIVPSLYNLLELLNRHKTADPSLKETVNGLLNTWARISERNCVIDTVWRVIENEENHEWHINIAGELHLAERILSIPIMSLSDLVNGTDEDVDVDANPLDLRPDPAHFTRFLKSMDREDVVSDVFVKLLEAYRELSLDSDSDPMKSLLYLQLILQMQAKFTDTASSTNILKKPAHILSFINHALELPGPSSQDKNRNRGSTASLNKHDLKFLEDDGDDDESVDEGDSDDEDAPGLEGVARKDEMAATAINLLLSILEANSDLSARTDPVLNEIFSQLEPLANGSSESLRRIAREARMVLTARLASTSANSTRSTANNEDKEKISAQEKYQRALKLLQDPILPVRAHGLLLLRELVAPPSSSKTSQGTTRAPILDPAFKPAVLSIFLESVQDEDSYIFLNAVQGLAAMVDGFGKDVLRGLIDEYMKGLDDVGAAALSQKDMDVRLRLGEALGQVIRRCGGALSLYVGILVPPLFKVLRTIHLPTIIRTSAVSLLAQCVDTNATSILPYMSDLTSTMVDLLQIETVSASSSAAATKSNTSRANIVSTNKEKADISRTSVADVSDMTSESSGHLHVDADTAPAGDLQHASDTDQSNRFILSANSKLPPFRRAALHFLSLLIQSYTLRVYDTGALDDLATIGQTAKRMKTVLSYVATVDEDNVVRLMARECVNGFNELQKAILSV